MAIINRAFISISSCRLSQLCLENRFVRSFSSKNIDDIGESPRLREFRKKLRERTPIEKLDELEEDNHPYREKEPLKPFPNHTNPETGEIGGPYGPEPTRYGDWERKDTFVLKTKEDLNTFLENDWESPRIKQFHQKLKLQPIPKLGPRDRIIDLILVETDSKTGELIINSKTEPTKWGDWQTGGRVSDF